MSQSDIPGENPVLVRRAGDQQTALSVRRWLEDYLTGRAEPAEIERLARELAERGEVVADPDVPVSYTLLDAQQFAAQLRACRQREPQLLETELPDHWLGEY